MRTDELQFIADTALVEKVMLIEAAFNEELRAELRKEAGFGDILGGITGAIKSFVKDHVDTSSTAGFSKSILNLLAPAALFRLNPIVGIMMTVSDLAGVSFTDVVSKIVSAITPSLVSGNPVSPAEINQAAQGLAASASADLFHDLRELEEQGLFKSAQRAPLGGGMLRAPKGRSAFYRMFEFLSPRKRGTLFVAFAAWLVKTVLASAGMLAVGKATQHAVGLGKDENKPESAGQATTVQTAPSTGVQQEVKRPPAMSMVNKPNTLNPSGAGTIYHANDDRNMWVVPLYGDVKNTLARWAMEIYPQLAGSRQLIFSSASFNNIANMLSRHLDRRYPRSLIMPPNINTRKLVVDQFAADVERQLKQRVTV